MRASTYFMVVTLFVLCCGSLQSQILPPPSTAEPQYILAPGAAGQPYVLPYTPYITPPAPFVPSPVEPSELPSGYVPPAPTPAIPEISENVIEFSGPFRTASENGVPVRTESEGPVTVRYKNVVVTACSAVVDHKTNIAIFRGNVVFRMGVQQANADEVVLNLQTREWTAQNGTSTIKPEFAQGYLEAPVFLKAHEIDGAGQCRMEASDEDATTCNLAYPHYTLAAKSMTVIPNVRIVFKNVKVYVHNKKIVSFPRIVIPLRHIEQNPRIAPTFGQNETEGFFLKTSYAYSGSANSAGFLLLDLMTSKGVGKGIRQTYQRPNYNGEVQIYQLFDTSTDNNTLTGHLTHTQRFGNVQANISSDWRSNSYLYAPDSKSLINRATFTRRLTNSLSVLSINQATSETYTRTSNLTANLKHNQRFGSTSTLDAGFSYIGNTANSARRAQLTSEALFTQDAGKFDWRISARKLTDLSDESFAGRGIFFGLETLPEIGLTTDTSRFKRTLFGIPASINFTFGQYNELPANTDLTRTYFELNTPVKKRNLTDTWNLLTGGGFQQFIYSDGTAQYSVNASAQMTKTFGPTSSFNLVYRYQKPKGYTPFRTDFVANYNVINANLNLRDNRKFRLSVLSGYNFAQKKFPWQDITLRFSIEPSDKFLFYTATGYNINNSQWRTLINQFRFRAGEGFKLDLGTRYDTTTNKLANIKFTLDKKIGNELRLQALGGYNGITKSFDYKGFKITRDLHCWEASLQYMSQNGFYKSNGIMLNLRIKAFPFYDSFGAGQFGEALDTSVGQVY